MIHREALFFRSLPKVWMLVLDQVITMVNFTKSRPLASRLFSQFCEAMDFDYKMPPVSHQRSLVSRGIVFKRVVQVQLKAELISFLEAEKRFWIFYS